jgi:prevent-host-death family protein
MTIKNEVMVMPTIRASADLRNNYSEISKICNEYNEPVFITKNGKGDLAVMSIDLYNQMAGTLELYQLLDDGMDALRLGRQRPFQDALKDIRGALSE